MIASLFSLMVLKPGYLPLFIFTYYYNPISLYMWFSPKNKTKEEKLNLLYKRKNYLEKFLIYLKYTSMLSIFYSLNIYF